MSTSDFWIDSPPNLWKFNTNSIESILNTTTLIIIIITTICSLLLSSIKPFYFGAISIALVASIYYLFYADKSSSDTFDNFVRSPNLRLPSPNNPLMNVPITDYDQPQQFDDYQHYNAINENTTYNNSIRNKVDDEFVKGLYMNPSDMLWKRENSQRQYISQPIGNVPNDTVELAQWLYGNTEGSLCKQASIWDRYGLDYVENNCNGYNVSTPTNFGRIQNKA